MAEKPFIEIFFFKQKIDHDIIFPGISNGMHTVRIQKNHLPFFQFHLLLPIDQLYAGTRIHITQFNPFMHMGFHGNKSRVRHKRDIRVIDIFALRHQEIIFSTVLNELKAAVILFFSVSCLYLFIRQLPKLTVQ